MIPRTLATYIREILPQYDVLTVTGPRQAGKTTLCRALFPELPYVNLEAPDVRDFALTDPNGFLNEYPEGAILDEIQRTPELPSWLQVRVDEPQSSAKYILSGSQSFSLRSSLSQSLAGRTAILELLPFSLMELSTVNRDDDLNTVLYKGGFPRVYDRQIAPTRAMSDYVATYVERDLRQLNLVRDLQLFQKFLQLCAGRIGQLLNLNSLANDVGISHTTAKDWMTLLEASYIIFRLPPYFRNIGKRLMKSPKLYFYDTALACFLLNIEEAAHLTNHPLRGPLFENLVILEALKSRLHQGKRNNLQFYRDSNGNEVDLLQTLPQGYLPFEIKLASTFTSSFEKGIRKFSENEACPRGSVLVYTGQKMKRGALKCLNWTDLRNFFAEFPIS